MMRKILVFILIFIVSGIMAFTEDWPMFQKDVLRSSRTEEIFQPPLSLKWKYKTEDKIASTPAVVEEKVFFGSRDKNFYCLNAASGSLLWKFESGGLIDSSPAVAEGKVYFSSQDGYLYCLNADNGNLIYKYKTGGQDSSSPLLSQDRIFCASGFPNKYIYSLDAETGALVWQFETGQIVHSSAASQGNNIYIGSNDGNIYCLNKNTGGKVWDYHTKGGIYLASPAINEQALFIAPGNFDWSVYALKLSNGSLLWKYDLEDKLPTPNYVSNIALADDALFFVSGYTRQHLYCLDVLTGDLKYKVPLSSSTRLGFSSAPCLTKDTVYVADGKGKLIAVEAATGSKLWEYDLGEKVVSSVVVANDRLYVGTLDASLYCFE
ncbi:MAG: PQQ-binding-like beta-propeller repeat protein [Candidatus Omnitrophica bacterium]|nr:PQQ-binding-like beta-propeller repeat protein [Candidatus Omnitrophota bacterium]